MSRSKVGFFAGLALAAIVATPSASQAQLLCVGNVTCGVSPIVSLTIPRVVRLAVAQTTIVLDTLVWSTDSLNGQNVATTYAGVNVRSNMAWTINVSAAAANWTYVGSELGVRPRATLLFQPNCAGVFSQMSAIPAMVLSGIRTNGASPNLCLQTNFPADYADAANRPGAYTLTLTLTLAAN